MRPDLVWEPPVERMGALVPLLREDAEVRIYAPTYDAIERTVKTCPAILSMLHPRGALPSAWIGGLLFDAQGMPHILVEHAWRGLWQPRRTAARMRRMVHAVREEGGMPPAFEASAGVAATPMQALCRIAGGHLAPGQPGDVALTYIFDAIATE